MKSMIRIVRPVRQQEGVNVSQSDFASKHWKWTLHFNWDEASSQTKNTSANKWYHDYKTFLILTWDQQNKRIANRTPKSSKRSNTVSSTSDVFSSTKFCSWIQNWTKQTLIEMKVYTHLSKYVSKISPNFELNWTYESPTDLKIHPEIGVLLGFSRTSSNWVFLKSRPKSATTRCMQWSEECNSPPINPQTKSSQRNQRVFTNNTRSGKSRNQDYKTLEISATIQIEIWSQKALWAGPAILPLIKLENKEHSQSTKSLQNPRLNWCLPREKTRSSRTSAQNKWQPRDTELTSSPLYL
jgi:hypothetical protein